MTDFRDGCSFSTPRGLPARTHVSRKHVRVTVVSRAKTMRRGVLFALVFACVSFPNLAHACSTFLVGAGASHDGSVIVSHSDDGEGNPDARLSFVPARDHLPGARRPVWPDLEDNPRFVGMERGTTYEPGRSVPPDAKPTKPIGFIPQINHTFGYHEGNYGVLNEKQLGIGESTCSGRFVASSIGNGGDALFCVNELSRIAMERCATARCAVLLMGSLAFQFGFYGASGSFEGGSETLLIGDTTEGWVMHFVPYPETNAAVWVAKRVPHDHVTVVMNMFTIREVDLEDTDNFLASPNLLDVAVKHGLWDPQAKDHDASKTTPFDFTKAFSAGEYAHKFYSGRRCVFPSSKSKVWGGFRLVNREWTDANLSPEYDDLRLDAPYPFSVKPAKKVTLADVFKWHRDWYQGTDYDLSKGSAGGPFGVPDRFTAAAAINGTRDSQARGTTNSREMEKKDPTKPKPKWGAWERSIALHRTTYTHVTQSRGWLPSEIGGVMWIGMHAAHGTVFLPTPCGVSSLFHGLTVGNATVVDRTSTWWAHRFVMNLARGMRFDLAIGDIREAQMEWERKGEGVLKEMERLFLLGTVGDEGRNIGSTHLGVDGDTDGNDGFSGRTPDGYAHRKLGLTKGGGDTNETKGGETFETEGASTFETVSTSQTAMITRLTEQHARLVTEHWWKLGDSLMAKYADGFVSANDGKSEPGLSVGYPDWWLEAVGYADGPPPPPDPPKNGFGVGIVGRRELVKTGWGASDGEEHAPRVALE